MKTSEIRQRFLNFFANHNHTIVESSSLVPTNDPTLLFTNAGMVQFKDVFLGKEQKPYKRATTSQKVVRAGGKHNDLENVGFTARHHTFFEMLGNFSFGDYFKKEAIQFAWSFVTKELRLDPDKLYVTVHTSDDEAFAIWNQQEGVPAEKIYRMGDKDNFWSMGETGPCGPCTEIFIDRGAKYGCGKSTCAMGCDCDRYMEFWNLVFMQYDRNAQGEMKKLPRPSVDTGAGLERIAAIMQDCPSNYETDAFLPLIQQMEKICGRVYNADADQDPFRASFRVVADHARACTFLIADGVLPSNEGRGYVLRRIMRRAIRHGKKLGCDEKLFLSTICSSVIALMKGAFPELSDKREFIKKVVDHEEELFRKTLERGLSLLDDSIKHLPQGETVLPGDIAFKLYDTFGFPLDLTRTICAEVGVDIDDKTFDESMAKQRATSRKNWKGSGQEAEQKIFFDIAATLESKKTKTKFVGYEALEARGECLYILKEENGVLKSWDRIDVHTQDPLMLVLSETCFYAEGGGQVGDQGVVESKDGFRARVVDVQKYAKDLVVVTVEPSAGSLRIGEFLNQRTDQKQRMLTARNHTATHLLHAALRKTLGDHVKQAGSLVDSSMLRFDFSHFSPLNPQQISEIESLINGVISQNLMVTCKEMTKDEAVAKGAIAFFGEKYGDRVRVVSAGDFSIELCGGTHVAQTGDVGYFKILSEQGIASGVRRIVALTSDGAMHHLNSQAEILRDLCLIYKASNGEELKVKLEKLSQSEKDLRKALDAQKEKASANEAQELLALYRKVNDIGVLIHEIEGAEDLMKRLREISEKLMQKREDGLSIIFGRDVAKNYLCVAAGKIIRNQYPANDVLKILASKLGLKGGGKPDMAQAAGEQRIEKAHLESLVADWLASKAR